MIQFYLLQVQIQSQSRNISFFSKIRSDIFGNRFFQIPKGFEKYAPKKGSGTNNASTSSKTSGTSGNSGSNGPKPQGNSGNRKKPDDETGKHLTIIAVAGVGLALTMFAGNNLPTKFVALFEFIIINSY